MRKYLALALLLVTGVASAYDYTGRFGIGGNAGYNFPVFGNNFNTAADSDWLWGMHGRYHFNSNWGVEAGYSRHEFADTTIAAQVFDGLAFYRFKGTERFTPVAGLGAGVVDLSHYSPNSLKMGLKARIGAEYAINECLSAAFNVDYQRIDKMLFGDNMPGRVAHIIAPRVALTWYFGGQKERPAAQPAPVKKEGPVAAAAPVDGDADNDGVKDSLDKCPNSAPGTTVNAYGCAKEEKAEIRVNVEFASGKAVIAQAYHDQLKSLADFLNTHKRTTAVIEGHTDSSGPAALNKKLSQARAESVKDYLIKKFGIESRRLSASGLGAEKPISDNKTVDGKARNRRVMAVVSE